MPLLSVPAQPGHRNTASSDNSRRVDLRPSTVNIHVAEGVSDPVARFLDVEATIHQARLAGFLNGGPIVATADLARQRSAKAPIQTFRIFNDKSTRAVGRIGKRVNDRSSPLSDARVQGIRICDIDVNRKSRVGVTASWKPRKLTQVTVGVIAGGVLIALAAIGIQNTEQFSGTETGGLTIGGVALLIGYVILMLCVCRLACIVPTLRALRVQPTQPMRAE